LAQHLVHLHTGVHGEQAHGVVRRAEVEDGQVRDDPVHVVVLARGVVVADTGHDVHGVHEDARVVPGDPVARAVVGGVARCAAEPQQLPGRLLVVADAGDVLVAEAVDLVRAHHHVPAAVRHDVEHPPVRHPALHRGLRGQQERLAVGQQQVGLGGQPGQPRAQRGQQAHRAGQDLARAEEQVGARHRADLGPGHVAHAVAPW
jgi:hypothetical protein